MTEYDNTDLFEAKSKSILRFLNVFITIFKEDLQIAKKLNLSLKNVQIFFLILCLFSALGGRHKSAMALHFSVSLLEITMHNVWLTLLKKETINNTQNLKFFIYIYLCHIDHFPVIHSYLKIQRNTISCINKLSFPSSYFLPVNKRHVTQ